MQMSEIMRDVRKAVIPSAKRIVASGQQHAPICIIHGKDGVQVMLFQGFGDEAEKEAASVIMQGLCRKHDADYCVFVSECWYVNRAETVDIESIRPSEQLDMKEAINIMVNAPDGHNRSIMIPIIRSGKKVAFGRMKIGRHNLGGRFVFTW